MSKKKSGCPHGHYCKICGEYKANEKFSGKGHAAHICKACSRLSAAEKAETQTITRLMNFPMGRLSANDKAWLENRLHDHRPEVAELAREVYNMHFPVNRRSTANRISRVLTMIDFDGDGTEQSMTLDGKKMSTLLRWAVHSLEIFMWPEDYDLAPSRNSVPPYFDLLPEYWPDEDEEADEDFSDENMPEGEVCWRVQIEYANHTTQEIVSYQDYLMDRPEELYLALLEYFEPETDDFDEEYAENAPLE